MQCCALKFYTPNRSELGGHTAGLMAIGAKAPNYELFVYPITFAIFKFLLNSDIESFSLPTPLRIFMASSGQGRTTKYRQDNYWRRRATNLLSRTGVGATESLDRLPELNPSRHCGCGGGNVSQA